MPLFAPRLRSLVGLLCIVAACAPASANPQLASIPGARVNMEVLEPFSVQSKEFSYPHQVTVALPASYSVQPARKYPVLWFRVARLSCGGMLGFLVLLVLGLGRAKAGI